MARLFFIFWICSNIFRNFSGCRRSILISEMVIRFVISIGFPMPYSKLFYCKNSRRYSEKKTENDGSAFLHFWIRSNIFRDFSGCRLLILISEKIIRFVCPLAFQCRIPNYSTAKTREDMAKRKRKVENDCSAFLHFLDSFKHISRFLGL